MNMLSASQDPTPKLQPPSKRVAWAPKGARYPANQIGAVMAPMEAQSPDQEQMYLRLIADQVQRLLEAEPDPEAAARALFDLLGDLNLMPGWDGQTESAANQMILDNALMPDYLRAIGLDVSRLPNRIKPSKEAKATLEAQTLEEWMQALDGRGSGL